MEQFQLEKPIADVNTLINLANSSNANFSHNNSSNNGSNKNISNNIKNNSINSS